MVILILVILGLVFGSFANALAWRTHNGKDILGGRSQCPACGRKLGPLELIPVLSFLFLRGRCSACQAKIALHYPLIELLGGLTFVASYIYWPASLSGHGQLVLFIAWLVVSVGLLALLVSDHLWMLLPNKIIYSSLVVAVIGQLIYLIGYASDKPHQAVLWGVSVLVASGIFFVMHEISQGQWIGFGDVRLGLVTGTILASPAKSFLMIFLASVMGVVYSLPHLLVRRRTLSDRIPYGPFLIVSAALVLLFGGHVLDWYNQHLLHP